jgi:large subunit ribosomal protein L30
MLLIKLVKSKAGTAKRQKATLAALGLRKMQQVVQQDDTASIRGMIHHVRHMVSVEEVAGSKPAKVVVARTSAPKVAPKPKVEAAPVAIPKAAKAPAAKSAAPKAATKAPAKKKTETSKE